MTSAYNNFKSFMQNLIRLESSERVTLNSEGYRNHYTVDDDAFAVLQSLASDVVNSDEVADLTDAKREAIAFVLHVTLREFNHFLQNMNARYYVTEIFYPQSVEEFCYHRRDFFPLADWVAETFKTNDDEEEIEEEAEEEVVETEEQEEITPERAALCSRAAMNLMNALNRRDGSILVISRSGDEPMTVDVNDLLSLSSFDARVEFIGNMNNEDAETVEKCLATGRLTFDDDPDDDDDNLDDEDDTELDDDDSGSLTGAEILPNPRLNCVRHRPDDDDLGDETPRWLRNLRREFLVATVRIESARRRHDDKLEAMIRADAVDMFLHTAVEKDLTLTALYQDNHCPLNRAIALFFDALNAYGTVDESYNLDLHRYVRRRASLDHKRHVAAIRYLSKASDETMRLLYEAIAEGIALNIKGSGSYINLVG